MKSKHIVFVGGALLFGVAVMALSSCKSIPKGASVVTNFDVKKYLGKWYEIARIDFKFERHMNNTTANYTLQSDGRIKVVNAGYHTKDKKWKSATGKAKFRGSENIGAIKVSFFGPFYSGYNVIAIDGNYKYALVAGKNLDYLWILSREKQIPSDVKQQFLEKAAKIGYDTSRLLWVEHDS